MISSCLCDQNLVRCSRDRIFIHRWNNLLGDPSCCFIEISIWYGQTTWPSFEQKKNVTTGHQMPLGHPGVVRKFTQHKWKMWSSAMCESTTRKNRKETWQCHSDLFGMHPRKYRKLVFGRFYGETQLMEMNVATATELPGGGFWWTQRLWTWPPRIKDWGWKRSCIESLGRFIFCDMKSLLVHMGVPTNRYLNSSLIGAGITYPFFKFKHLHPPTVALFSVMCFRCFFSFDVHHYSQKILNLSYAFHVYNRKWFGFLNRQAPKTSLPRKRWATNKKPQDLPTKNSKPPKNGPSEAKFVKSW